MADQVNVTNMSSSEPLSELMSLPAFNEATVIALKLEAKYLDHVFNLYWESAQREINDIGQALDDVDQTKLRKVAHSLKGSSRMLGGERLGALAGFVEQKARQNESISEPQLLDCLHVSLADFKRAVLQSNLLS
ncbi:Hpt domain-containing protein [Neptuniibacter sp. QD48_11]|uniref:Hpt domain-containing protein n=1 Tax=unclassified Neptuniibacter TaxID=2630693 RepID=UPI0039F4D317